jgi:hypothetical protein
MHVLSGEIICDAKVRNILGVSKQATQNFDVGRFNLW